MALAAIVETPPSTLSRVERFMLGALGGILPVLAALLAADIAAFIDGLGTKTVGSICGIVLHVVILVVLGGIIALLNREVTNPLSLVQLGIAAPALITAYINTSPPSAKSPEPGKTSQGSHFSVVSQAYAGERSNVVRVGGFLDDVLKGVTDPLSQNSIGAARSADALASAGAAVRFGVTNPATGSCFNIYSKNNPNSVVNLRDNFPDYSISTTGCPVTK